MVMLSAEMRAEMAKIAEQRGTIAGKIRALGEAGYANEDIARYFERSPQQASQVPEIGKTPPRFRLVVEPDGRLTIPAAVLHALGLGAGDVAIGFLQDDEFVLIHWQTAVRRAQEIVRSYASEGVSLVDELIADRRREAERENEGR